MAGSSALKELKNVPKDVHNNLQLPSEKWSDQTSSANRECKLGEHGCNNIVVQSLNDFTWLLKVNGVEVDGDRCPSLSMFQNPL